MATEEKKTVIAEEEAPASKKAAPKKAAKATKAKKAVKKEAVEEKKEEVKEAPKATEASAKLINYGVTPRKVRLVIDLVRGKDVKDALAILAITNKAAVTPVEKLIKSAAANAINNFHMDGSKLYISEIQVSDGLKIKRYIPRAKGSASGIIKRNANIRITVKERN